MTRATSFLLAAAVALAPLGCKKKKEPEGPVRGSGVGSKVERSVAPFTKLRVGGSVRAEVEVGKPASLTLLGEDNLLPHVVPKVEAGTLVLEPTIVLKSSQPLVARITTPSLESAEFIVASKGIVRGVKAQHFVVRLAGAGSMELEGTSQTLEVTARASGKADLKRFPVSRAKVTTTEAARVDLGHVEALEVTQRGPSIVTYQGSPEIKRTSLPPARLYRTGS